MKYKTVVGIDPDVDKSGVATLDTKTRQMIATDLPFPFLVDFLRDLGDDNEDESIVVVVEASWLISYNWHTKNGDNRRVSAAKGNSTGRNHETGRKIVEMCKHYDLDVIVPDPAARQLVHDVIFNELCVGVEKASSRAQYREIMAALVQQGAEGIIFGCTEIPMLVDQSDASVPVFDTTTLHASYAAEWALS